MRTSLNPGNCWNSMVTMEAVVASAGVVRERRGRRSGQRIGRRFGGRRGEGRPATARGKRRDVNAPRKPKTKNQKPKPKNRSTRFSPVHPHSSGFSSPPRSDSFIGCVEVIIGGRARRVRGEGEGKEILLETRKKKKNQIEPKTARRTHRVILARIRFRSGVRSRPNPLSLRRSPPKRPRAAPDFVALPFAIPTSASGESPGRETRPGRTCPLVSRWRPISFARNARAWVFRRTGTRPSVSRRSSPRRHPRKPPTPGLAVCTSSRSLCRSPSRTARTPRRAIS
jgi:hypothetical protein